MKKLAALLCVAALGACYKLNFELQPPQAEAPSMAYNDHLHVSVINIIEVSSPVDVNRACGGTPATSIHEHYGVLAAVVNLVFNWVIPVLSVEQTTVSCGVGGMAPVQPMPAPTQGQPPPPAQP